MSIFAIKDNSEIEVKDIGTLNDGEYYIVRFRFFDTVNDFLLKESKKIEVIQFYSDLDYYYLLIRKKPL